MPYTPRKPAQQYDAGFIAYRDEYKALRQAYAAELKRLRRRFSASTFYGHLHSGPAGTLARVLAAGLRSRRLARPDRFMRIWEAERELRAVKRYEENQGD